MQISKFIADCIKHRLEELRLNRQEFAYLLEVQPSTITKYLSGTHNFAVETLEKIQNVLSVKFFSYEAVGMPLCRPCIIDDNLFFYKNYSCAKPTPLTEPPLIQ